MYKIFGLFIATIMICCFLMSCGVDDNPVATEEEQPSELTISLSVLPPSSLRTLDTWNSWNVPLEAVLVVEMDGSGSAGDGDDHGKAPINPDGLPVITLSKVVSSQEEGDEILLGTVDLPGMTLAVTLADGEGMWEMEHDGEMIEHHAEEGNYHLEVTVVETATGHDSHGGVTISHCEVTVIAVSSAGDTIEVELMSVQSGHGFRYESNVELPYDIYDISLEIEPPTFFRNDETKDLWTSDIEVEFSGFDFDSTYSGSTIGQSTWVGAAEDTLLITLRGGSVKTYGAIGMGELPKSGDETINFSVRLEDPTRSAHGQALYEASVMVSVHNSQSGETTARMLKPMYSDHGFHFGNNMALDLGQITGEDGHDDGH